MLSKIEEITLITRCVAADDRRAFERLVNEHSASVRNFLFRLTAGDAATADDLAQETFIKAYTRLRSFKAMARFRTWLLSIAYNEFVDYARKQRESRLPDDDATFADRRLGASDAGNRRTEMRHDIAVALAALNETERTLIVLFYLDDLPIKEICRITALPSGTVKSYLSRAKTKMARSLADNRQETVS